MGFIQTTTNEVICDNPNCPNKMALPNGLSNTDPNGWLLITSVTYGQNNTLTGFFCSWPCAVVIGQAQ